ncbi:MAG: alanine--glyoxylate aminotransferase family protein [Bdellovibrionales bacterium]|nr:alanine--glyoxylate aminotransferase family protein [Bdellovibrionales bacterium]
MEQITLFTPGPTHIPTRVFEKIANSGVHHRTPQFQKIFSEAQSLFSKIVDSPDPPLFLACSGTGAMETALRNSCSMGDAFLYIDAGKFGERWGKIGEALGLNPIPIKSDWGTSPSEEDVLAACKGHQNIKAFCTQHCETSTTVLHPIETYLPLVRSHFPDAITIVDAISSLTTAPLSVSQLGIDILIAASQKALMLPPGLSILSISDNAWGRIEHTDPRSLYFNLKKERKPQLQGSSAWTPALHLILGLHEVLTMIQEEGLDKWIARHKQCSAYAQEALSQLGFRPISKTNPSPSVTGAFSPEGLNPDHLRKKLTESSGYLIAGGQDDWKGKILRVGHMGLVTPHHLEGLFGAIRDCLSD